MAVKLVTLAAVTGIGTAKAISTKHTAVTSLTIQSDNGNTGSVFVGDSSVTTGTGLIVDEGDVAVLTADNVGVGSEEFFLDEIYVVSGTGSNTVRLAAYQRRGAN